MKKKYKELAVYSEAIPWLGTDAAFDTYCAIMEKYSLGGVVHPSEELEEDDDTTQSEPLIPELLTIQDRVGIISIQGILTNEQNWWNSYAGLVAYPDIIEAALFAGQSPEIDKVLLDISSPGGTVSGVTDAVESLRSLAKVKTTFAYTDSQMCSGAYFLGAAAKKRYAGALACVGSIGVVMKHREFSKMLEAEGVTDTVIRAGKFKQLLNPSEPLSKLGLSEAQAQVDHMYGVFTSTVADLLGVTLADVEKMAQGREFIGSQAVDVGLIDGISTFNKVFAGLTARKGGDSMKKSKYSAAALSAMTGAEVPVEAEATDTPAAEVKVEAGAAVPEGEVEATPVEAEVAAAPVSKDSEVVAMLRAQLAEAQEALINTRVDLATLTAQAGAYEADLAPLRSIVAGVTNGMVIAMNGVEDATLEALPAQMLVKRHEAVLGSFITRFPAGRVSAAAATDESTPQVPKRSPVEEARLKASKTTRK